MATEVKLPELAEGVEKGEVTDVFVKEGDVLEVDSPILEVNAEKATLTVPSTVKGRIGKLMVKKGDKIAVGQTLLTVEGQGAATAADKQQPAEKKDAPKDVSTGPAAVTESAAQPQERKDDGYSAHDRIESTEEPSPKSVQQHSAPAVHASEELIPAGPAVRRIARELGIDLTRVQGSGRNGRITVDDLDPYIKGYVANRGGGNGFPAAAPAVPAIELPDFSKFGPVRRERADALRRKVAERMAQSWSSVPHVHQFHEAEVTELLGLMKRQKERVKQAGGSLTFTVFAMKAVVLALKEFPKFNATWDSRNGEIIYKDYYNVGVAVDTPGGLLVPVVRDVDKKTLLDLAIELPALAQRTRDKKTTIEDLRGGTFTISNLGGIGGSFFTPIVNAPEVAILGIGRSQRRPVFDKNGQVVAQDICPLALGYDHRIIDGAEGARFIVRVGEILENFEAAFLGF